MEVTIKRDGYEYFIRFKDGGKLDIPLTKRDKTSEKELKPDEEGKDKTLGFEIKQGTYFEIKGREKSETLDKRTRTQYDRNGQPIAKTERKEEEIPRFRRIRVAKDVINISCVAIEKETKKV